MRIDDIGPNAENSTLGLGNGQSYSGKALCVALSADGTRAYLGGHSGVWRSDDGGANWSHPEWPEPPQGVFTVPGALQSLNVYDIAISPISNDIVFAATGNDAQRPDPSGIYLSLDGALNWALKHQFVNPSDAAVFPVGHLVIAADNPQLMFAAGGVALARSTDGGNTWNEVLKVPFSSPLRIWHVVVGPLSATGRRRVFACANNIWESKDGGDHWIDHGAPPMTVGGPGTGGGSGPHALGLHPKQPNKVYLCADDQLWSGRFASSRPLPPVWRKLPGVPIIPNGPTESGVSFVMPRVAADGHVFFIASDRRTTCMAPREPVVASDWQRIDSQVHVDPHGIALTPDFRPRFTGGSAGGGRALLVNDGGAWVSTDGAANWVQAKGLSTLNVANAAVSAVPGQAPLVTFGGGDNESFASADGGLHWQTQDYLGGDNDCSFADPRQPTRMMVFAPRSSVASGAKGEIYLYVSANNGTPNIVLGTGDRRRVPGPDPLPALPGQSGWSAVSNFWNVGYRPLVLTGAAEQPRPDGDFIVIRYLTDSALLLRTTSPSSIATAADWATGATSEADGAVSFQVGPPLPLKTIAAAQASGGHDATVFYVGDPADFTHGDERPGTLRLWKWAAGMPAWKQMVPLPVGPAVAPAGPAGLVPPLPPPGVRPSIARRFFVDPFRPDLLYVLGNDHVYRSQDGGTTWVVDASLEFHLTAAGAYPFNIPYDTTPQDALLRDMQFDAHRPGLRFAVGPAGVFFTQDGTNWRTLLNAIARGFRATSLAYDDRSCDRALYVGTSNRGLLRASPIPPDWEFPVGSLQAAEGLVTLLRVHEVGTGFGPSFDLLDAEVIVMLDTQPEKAFGFQLRADGQRAAAQGKLDLLQDVFDRGAWVHIEFIRSGCRTGRIIRVVERS